MKNKTLTIICMMLVLVSLTNVVLAQEYSEFFDIYFMACEDRACNDVHNLFEIGSSRIYLSAFETESADLSGVLTLPDGLTEELVFDNNVAEVSLSQLGEYSAEITASAENYFDFTTILEFKSVEQIVVAEDLTHICNLDDICGADEDIQNCPQDCVGASQCNADVNSDGVIDDLDMQFVVNKINGDDCNSNWCNWADITRDGAVNAFDLAKLRQQVPRANINRDLTVNAFDLAILRRNMGGRGCGFTPDCAAVDLNGDKDLNALDFQVVEDNLGGSCDLSSLTGELWWLWLLIGILIILIIVMFVNRKKVKKGKK